MIEELDHAGAALARRAEEFKAAARLETIVRLLCAEVQAVETAFWALLADRTVDAATAGQLDVIGRIVGQVRGNSADDDAYRLRIRARIRLNLSSGTTEDVLAVFAALAIGAVVLTEFYPAGQTLRLVAPVAAADVTLYSEFLQAARGAGVRTILEWVQGSATEQFNFALFAVGGNANIAGAAVVGVDSTAGFPQVGTLRIDEGLAAFESAGYVDRDATHFYLSGTLASNHANGAAVCLADVAEGFSDTTEVAGGQLAGANDQGSY